VNDTALQTEPKQETTSPSDKSTAQLVYLLMAIGFVFGLTYLIGGIMALLKKGEEPDPVLKAHYSYQARTFSFSVLWLAVGIITAFFLVGYLVLLANYIWALYRTIKGWLALSEGRTI
jgi:uncharacterized membrane protein